MTNHLPPTIRRDFAMHPSSSSSPRRLYKPTTSATSPNAAPPLLASRSVSQSSTDDDGASDTWSTASVLGNESGTLSHAYCAFAAGAKRCTCSRYPPGALGASPSIREAEREDEEDVDPHFAHHEDWQDARSYNALLNATSSKSMLRASKRKSLPLTPSTSTTAFSMPGSRRTPTRTGSLRSKEASPREQKPRLYTTFDGHYRTPSARMSVPVPPRPPVEAGSGLERHNSVPLAHRAHPRSILSGTAQDTTTLSYSGAPSASLQEAQPPERPEGMPLIFHAAPAEGYPDDGLMSPGLASRFSTTTPAHSRPASRTMRHSADTGSTVVEATGGPLSRFRSKDSVGSLRNVKLAVKGSARQVRRSARATVQRVVGWVRAGG